jgi:protein-tyrosine phosphatase
MRFHIRSVGLSPKSNRQITERDVAWADLILVMERPQKTELLKCIRIGNYPE